MPARSRTTPRTSLRVRRGAPLLTGRRGLLLGSLVAGAVLVPALPAQATTGSDALAKPPIFTVSAAAAKPFLGGYSLSTHGSGLLASTMRTGYNTEGYLMGTISVTRYTHGQPGTFIAALYEYRRRGATMVTDLWTPDVGTERLGRLAVRRRGSELVGTLTVGRTPTVVTYKPVSSAVAQSSVTHAGAAGASSQPATTNAGIFSTAVVLAESISG